MNRQSALRRQLRELVPPALEPIARSLIGTVRFGGDYASFAEAAAQCEGYSAPVILEHVKRAALAAKRGEVAYEMDGVVFDERSYVWHLLTVLLFVAARHAEELHVLDFGGSLGSSYYRHRPLLGRLRKLSWSVVEQPHYVACGRESFEDETLRFFPDIESAVAVQRPSIVLVSGMIQYLPAPHEFLEKLAAFEFENVLFDRTPFIQGSRDRLTLQRVKEPNYPATYPAWFFAREAFLRPFEARYRLLEEFIGTDHANIPSSYRGLWFEARNELRPGS